MKERPILFSGAMVCALLRNENPKTQTRRPVKPQPEVSEQGNLMGEWLRRPLDGLILPKLQDIAIHCPYGQPGDRLYVRETWAQPTTLDPGPTFYRADYPACVPAGFENVPPADAITWKPSIHMPRAASRITLEVTGVRVERLGDISAADARAEGIECLTDRIAGEDCRAWRAYDSPNGWFPEGVDTAPIHSYRTLWDSLNAERGYGWDVNPWVWVVEFRRVV